MKVSKKVMALLIQIFIVSLALAMTVGTYAWYSSQREVHVSQTSVTSAAGANTVIESESNPEWDLYQGQDGTDNVDNAPYIIEKTMTVSFTPLQTPSYAQINLTSIIVSPQRGTPIDSAEYDSEDPTSDPVIPNFTWRMTYGGHVYQPDENGFAFYFDNNEQKVYLDVTPEQGESTKTLTNMVFHLVFLSEESYVTYLECVANETEPPYQLTKFAYSDVTFMRATFSVIMQIGCDIRQAEE